VAAGGPATERSDLYSAGGVLGEVAGDAPPRELAPLLDALRQEDPARRPASAEEALELLDPDATTRMATMARATDSTRRTAPLSAAAAAPADAVRRVDEVVRRPWFLPAAGIAAVVLLAVIVIALAAGGGGPSEEGAAASPAPASAPLEEQLRGLDRAIDAAASR